MVCWGNEGAVFELWLCWWGCPPTRTIKRSPAPGWEGSACAPAPGPSLCRRGGSRACRVPSSATSCERRAWLPGGSCRTRGGLQGTGLPLRHRQHEQPWMDPATYAGRTGRTDSTPEPAPAAHQALHNLKHHRRDQGSPHRPLQDDVYTRDTSCQPATSVSKRPGPWGCGIQGCSLVLDSKFSSSCKRRAQMFALKGCAESGETASSLEKHTSS